MLALKADKTAKKKTVTYAKLIGEVNKTPNADSFMSCFEGKLRTLEKRVEIESPKRFRMLRNSRPFWHTKWISRRDLTVKARRVDHTNAN